MTRPGKHAGHDLQHRGQDHGQGAHSGAAADEYTPDMGGDEGLRAVEAENRLLRRVIETITSNLDLDTLLASLIDLVTEATRGDACFLFLWDPDEEQLVLRAASPEFEGAVGSVRLRLGEGVSGWVAENREVVAIPEDKWSDHRYKYNPELEGERFTSMLSVPVVSKTGVLLGVFNVHTHARRDFSERDIRFLRLTASLVAESIEHAHLFGALADKESALEALVRTTIEAQEEERRRVATEIHDGVTQQLVSIWYRLQACGRTLRVDPGRAEHELATARDLVDGALEEARSAIYDLRPSLLDDLGLSPSLRALALSQLEGEAKVDLQIDDVVQLPPHLEVALYRIAQEALTNVRKHARASRVKITLREADGYLELEIEDDGCGFASQPSQSQRPPTSFGLTGMAERASLIGGELSLRSAPRRGTVVTVRVPTQAEART
jgi:two-component system NarL family sensor kinase